MGVLSGYLRLFNSGIAPTTFKISHEMFWTKGENV